MSMVDNSLHIHNMGVLQQTETVQRTRIEGSNEYGGIKLEKSTPQPRNDRPEPSPELKELRELAPYIANGVLVRPKPEVEHYDPKGPLEQLLKSMDSVRGSNPTLYTRCDQALDNIEESFLLLKSPPEYDTRKYAEQLKDQAQLLRDMSVGMFGKGEGSDVMIGGKDGVPLGPRIKEMLEQTAQELEDYSKYVGKMPDPRPTMQTVGHFKSFETLGATITLDHYIAEKGKEITNIVSRFDVTLPAFMEMSNGVIDEAFRDALPPHELQALKEIRPASNCCF